MTLTDGAILPDQAPPTWGFTSRRWKEYSYLWKEGGRVLISMIAAEKPGKGNFRTLVRAIEASGFKVSVPTPLPQMQAVLEHCGFKPHMERAPEMGEDVEVWERVA